MRTGLKIVKDGARMDWLRSMEAILPMVSAHIRGETTPDMFDAEPAKPARRRRARPAAVDLSGIGEGGTAPDADDGPDPFGDQIDRLQAAE